ncbi:MAG: restriction endonuclease subunit S [Bacteroidota bacterium]
MKTALKDIASIQTGIFAKPIAKGEVVYLQTRHFDDEGQLSSILYPDLNADSISAKHLLQDGDVLFAAKGNKNFAAIYESKNPAAVASTSFFVIRLLEEYHDKIIPEYLVWFINQADVQKELKGKAIGSSISSISKQVLEALEISIPVMQTQQSILKIAQLRNKEKKLKMKIELLEDVKIREIINYKL